MVLCRYTHVELKKLLHAIKQQEAFGFYVVSHDFVYWDLIPPVPVLLHHPPKPHLFPVMRISRSVFLFCPLFQSLLHFHRKMKLGVFANQLLQFLLHTTPLDSESQSPKFEKTICLEIAVLFLSLQLTMTYIYRKNFNSHFWSYGVLYQIVLCLIH